MSRRSLDDQDIKREQLDIEDQAGRDEVKAQNLEHEYSIPTAVKFTWLGTYFFFSLTLTIYNKLVLGKVSLDNLVASSVLRGLDGDAELENLMSALLTMSCHLVPFPMAPDLPARLLRQCWYLHHDGYGLLQALSSGSP